MSDNVAVASTSELDEESFKRPEPPNIEEEDICTTRGPNDILIQGPLLMMSRRSGPFQTRFLKVTNSYITYHSKAESPAVDRINFQDVDSILFFEGNPSAVKIFGREGTEGEGEQLTNDMSLDPETDFAIVTSRSGYFRGLAVRL